MKRRRRAAPSRRVVVAGLCVDLLLSGVAWADLSRANAEPNLEKRSQLALENAKQALKAARQAYNNGDLAKTKAWLTELQQSVRLAEESLRRTGKNPRKSPKYFKRAEIGTRELLRLIHSFHDFMSFDDRSMLDFVKAEIQRVHDSLLTGIMRGKPR